MARNPGRIHSLRSGASEWVGDNSAPGRAMEQALSANRARRSGGLDRPGELVPPFAERAVHRVAAVQK